MDIGQRLRFWPIAVLVVAGLLGAAIYGFTASNTVPASKAGDGSGAISGFVISNVKYNLNSTNPANIDSVTFDLDSTPPAGSVLQVKLVAAGSNWYSCTNVVAAVTCTTTAPQATVAAADELRVVVAQ